MKLFDNALFTLLMVSLFHIIAFYVMYGLFTISMKWMKKKHPKVFRKYLPQYLEEEEFY